MFSKKEDSNQTLAASSNKVTIHQWKQYDWQTYNHFLGYHTRSIAIIDCNKVANEDILVSDKLRLAGYLYNYSACTQNFILQSFSFSLFDCFIQYLCFDLAQIIPTLLMSMNFDIIVKFLSFCVEITQHFFIEIFIFLFCFDKS